MTVEKLADHVIRHRRCFQLPFQQHTTFPPIVTRSPLKPGAQAVPAEGEDLVLEPEVPEVVEDMPLL